MMPPPDHRHHRYHWVRHVLNFECWEWKMRLWYPPGDGVGYSPKDADTWGWEYVQPAIPPAIIRLED